VRAGPVGKGEGDGSTAGQGADGAGAGGDAHLLVAGRVDDRRGSLAESGRDRAYTTVATLVRILLEKGFLQQTNGERPFRHVAARSYEEVSRRLLGEVLDRVFRGSREQLLVRLMEQRSLTAKERARLREILGRDEP